MRFGLFFDDFCIDFLVSPVLKLYFPSLLTILYTKNIPRSCSKNFSELADDFWSFLEFEEISACLDILMKK
jgi:hypothetical protein